MRLLAIAITLLACAEAARPKQVFKRGAVATRVESSNTTTTPVTPTVEMASSTQQLEDIVRQVRLGPMNVPRTVLSPDGGVEYTFARREAGITSTRRFIGDNAALTNAQRMARGMQPRRPGRLYVGQDGSEYSVSTLLTLELRRDRRTIQPLVSPTMCPYPYSIEISVSIERCPNDGFCFLAETDISKCYEGMTSTQCVLIEFAGTGAVSVLFQAGAGGDVGRCYTFGSCCGRAQYSNLPDLPVLG